MESDNTANELFEAMEETIDEMFGEKTPFVVVIPSEQRIATNCDPETVVATLAAIVSSMLNGRAQVIQHTDDNGNDETPKPTGMN